MLDPRIRTIVSACLTAGLVWAWPASGRAVAQAPPPTASGPPPASPPRAGMPDEAGLRVPIGRIPDSGPNRLELHRRQEPAPLEAPGATRGTVPLVAPAQAVIDPNFQVIDLPTALRLANVQNPNILLVRQRVVEAEAINRFALVQFIPTLNGGGNYDNHTGVLQQSNGNILSINRASIYVGAGANAVAAGTVGIPGMVLQGNVADAVFAYLTTRQVVTQRQFATLAEQNQVFLQVTTAYSELLRGEAHRAVALQAREQARKIAELTASYAKEGEGREADANRAATELARRETAYLVAEEEILRASARLAALLNLDPSIRFHPSDAYLVPTPIVPGPMPLCELLALGLLRRPELGERRYVIREALFALEGAKLLPFSPTYLIGFSAGGNGGGSNLVRPVFGGFAGRTDFDVVFYWSLRNMGAGNVALIRIADAHLQVTRFQELAMLNQVRQEIAEAYAKIHARFGQIGVNNAAVESGHNAFFEDYRRIQLRGERTALPIELLDSFRLLSQARQNYVDSIVDYNEAQFEMYVALGQPPADALAHAVPTQGVFPGGYPSGPVTPPIPAAPAGAVPGAPPPGARAPSRPNPPTTLTAARVARPGPAPAGR